MFFFLRGSKFINLVSCVFPFPSLHIQGGVEQTTEHPGVPTVELTLLSLPRKSDVSRKAIPLLCGKAQQIGNFAHLFNS